MGGKIMANHLPPKEVIEYVWKTGFISKEMWRNYFFKGVSERSMLQDWKNMIDRGYLQPHSNNHLMNILVLNRKNKFVMQMGEDYPAYAPNASQLEHDQILLNGMLELNKMVLIEQWQTEAQLKMLRPNDFRVETQGQKIKYPDVILCSKNGNHLQVVAIEYERHQKSRKRYSKILSSYATLKRVDAVIWIVNNLAIQNVIIEQAKQVYFPFKERPIAFVSEQTWKTNPEKLVLLANEIIGTNRKK